MTSLERTFDPVAKSKNLEFACRIGPLVPETIFTDIQRVEQVLKNLLSNAFKFTEKGAVSLEIARGEGTVLFRVTDTGVGIPEEQLENIFQAFRQADGTTNRKYGGTGLGLSISRDLARLLGGDVTVASEPGKGSVFTLEIPEKATTVVPARKPAAPAPVHSAPQVTSKPTSPAKKPAAKSAPPARSSRLVLVVEDDESFAAILSDLARERDFEFRVAPTAELAIELAKELRPSAILLDLNLPDHSGLTVLDQLKRAPSTRHIPVHVISASDDAHAALEMGAVGFAKKPTNREELVDVFRKLESKLARRVRRVLVVEDDPIQRDGVCRLLAATDVETVAAGTVREALEILDKQTFDCVVTDLTLPDASGDALLSAMADRADGAFPPVIVYTGRSLSEEEERNLRRHSRSIIVKGARSPERLLDEVSLFLHQVESELPPERQRMLRQARRREAIFEDKRILVVEDDVRNIFALSSVLEPKGAKLEIARNGREALEKLEELGTVDAILMDIMMPEMDGYEAMRLIRKRKEWAKLPVIALTAKAMRDDQERCIAAGANDFITKPLDVETLLSLLRVWIRK